jgi:hypothetical protein
MLSWQFVEPVLSLLRDDDTPADGAPPAAISPYRCPVFATIAVC